ncbi:MAG: hypothetical protein AB7K24_30355 [Gemmataceae bacterium]
MAAGKPNFPSKTCPKCGELIHARSQSHSCGWVMRGKGKSAKTAPGPKRKVGRPAGSGKGGRGAMISLQDIQAVKALTDKIGAAKVKEIADLLG